MKKIILGILLFGVSFSFSMENDSFPSFSSSLSSDSSVVIDSGNVFSYEGRSIARDGKGWIYIVYHKRGANYKSDVFCVRSKDNGKTWENIGKVSDDYGDYANIAVSSKDTVHIIFRRPGAPVPGESLGTDLYWREYDGVNWGPIINVSNQHGTVGSAHYAFTFAMDKKDQPHAVWAHPNANLWHSFYNGTKWIDPEVVFVGFDPDPSIVGDKNGKIHLAIASLYLYYKFWSDSLWSELDTIDKTLLYSSTPNIIVDSFDRPAVVWSAGVGVNNADIYFSRLLFKGWTTPLNLSDTIGASNWANISRDRNDNLYLVWFENFGRDTMYYRKLQIAYRTFDRIRWSPIQTLTDTVTYTTVSSPPSLGYLVSDSGVDLLWTKAIYFPRTTNYIMYKRLSLLPPSGMEKESEKLKLKNEKLKLEVFPNPATSKANFRFQISDSRLESFNLQSSNLSIFQSSISIKIYDVQGRLVRQISIANSKSEIRNSNVVWDLRDEEGKKVSAGVYFVRLEIASPSSRNDRVEGKTQTKRVLVLR